MKIRPLIAGALLLSGLEMSSLSLDNCQQMAHDNYPLIEQYGLLQENKNTTLSNIKKAWIPQVSLSAQATYQSDVTSFPEEIRKVLSQAVEIKGLDKDQYRIAVDINQTIWDGGISKASSAVAKQEEIAASKNIDVQLYKIRETVNNLYFGILLADEALKQNALQIGLLEKNHRKLCSHLKNGTAMQCDADAVYARLLTVRQQNSKLASMRKEYCMALGLLIGTDDDSLEVEIPEECHYETDRNNRPELHFYDAQLSLLDAQKKRLDSAVTPRFSLFATGFYGSPGLNMFEDMVNPGWSLNYMVGIGMKWNLGSLYTRKNDLHSIEVKRKSAINSRDVFLFNSDIEINRKMQEIERNKQLVADDDEIIVYRSRIRKAAESKLDNGIIDITDLLQKITEENEALIARSGHRIELLKAQYELKHIINN